MNKATKTLIGFVTIVVLLSLFTAGAAIPLILASIICTAGISLIIWIPFSYAVGSLVVGIIEGFQKRGDKDNVSQANVVSNDQVAIINYIKQAKQNGLPDNTIFATLKSNGWAENAIHEGFGLVVSHQVS